MLRALRWLTRTGYSATTRPHPEPPRYQLDPVDPSNPAGCLVQALPTRNGQGYPRLSRASIDRHPRLAYRCPDVEYRRHGFVVWAVFRGADQLRDRRHDHVDRYTVFIVRGG